MRILGFLSRKFFTKRNSSLIWWWGCKVGITWKLLENSTRFVIKNCCKVLLQNEVALLFRTVAKLTAECLWYHNVAQLLEPFNVCVRTKLAFFGPHPHSSPLFRACSQKRDRPPSWERLQFWKRNYPAPLNSNSKKSTIY